MTITFDEIPYDLRKPGTYVEVAPVYDRKSGTYGWPARAVLLVQKLSTGSAAAATIYRITRPAQGASLFGAGSIGDRMVQAFKAANKTTDLYAIALADKGDGVQATGTFVFTGPATAAGTIAVHVADHRVTVGVAASDSATTIGAAVAAALTAVADLEVTASATTGTVTVTAKHKGEAGNALQLAVNPRIDDVMPAGVGCTVTAMSGGSGNPDVTTLLDAIAAEWFTGAVTAWTDSTSLAALAAWAAERYTAMAHKDVKIYWGPHGTFGQLGTLGGYTNSPHMPSAPGANRSASPPWAWAASLAGIAEAQLAADPARQLRGLALPGIAAPASADRFTEEEQDLLLHSGISTFEVDTDGTVRLDRVITTFKTTSDGAESDAWLDITVPATLSRIRYDWRAHTAATYPRHKLASDGSPAAEHSPTVVTPQKLHGSWAARCQVYERNGWIQDATETVGRSSFERDADDRHRVNSIQRVKVMDNLIVLAGRLEFEV
ncbi:phage tail sheath C-terminal domain-containing protein [Rhodoplanes sp. TEM]|uniref:Phage tail sheath C-terminal domain-containing protein n=1 Tax=Rhodoplanes tepidamans TaxID=200616 RepID=A0ABT5JE47_RHOTP|nr:MULTISPECIES: phage tail sheath subtilisin-like domain-containing protein [Rhodoplanes]MDC7787966.1 phage tail sheath C-terminal domain-containing protein [Rhodoplanes tepidamans]MDC7984806.1 phage tail sheath C-terminal domain-containing protein [Rhodoplanes sp. TEM]MDQ0358395.1 phage tail sheath gpL-like [Rhodoplanes tepidamans]